MTRSRQSPLLQIHRTTSSRGTRVRSANSVSSSRSDFHSCAVMIADCGWKKNPPTSSVVGAEHGPTWTATVPTRWDASVYARARSFLRQVRRGNGDRVGRRRRKSENVARRSRPRVRTPDGNADEEYAAKKCGVWSIVVVVTVVDRYAIGAVSRTDRVLFTSFRKSDPTRRRSRHLPFSFDTNGYFQVANRRNRRFQSRQSGKQ